MSTSEAQKKASMKYAKENIEVIRINVKKGEKDKIRDFATSKGMSMQGFILSAIKNDMERT